MPHRRPQPQPSRPRASTGPGTQRIGSRLPAQAATALRGALLTGSLLGSLCALPATVHAQAAGAATETRLSLRIPAGPLGQALNALASAAGIELSIDASLVQARHSTGLAGSYTLREAFTELLRGQGLLALRQPNGSYTLGRTAEPAPPAAPPADASQLPPVTVTASSERAGELPRPYAGGQVARGGRLGMLGNQDVMDTPFNITSYTAQTIKDQQARTLADVIANDPSVRTTFTEAGFVPSFQIRGFAASAWDVSLDGLFGVVPPQAAALDFAERVEILKGPSALLNGLPPAGAIGGTINLVPKRAQDEPTASATASYFSKSQPAASVDLGRRFGEDKQIGVRFNGSYRDGDTAVDHQKQKLGAAALGLDYRGERVRLSADVGYQSQDMDGSQRPVILGTNVAVPRPPKPTTNWSQPWSFADIRDHYYALRGEVDLGQDWTLSAAAGGRKNEAYYMFSNASVLNTAGNFTESLYNYPQYTDTDTQQLNLRGRFATGPVRHSLIVSASRYHAEAGGTTALLGPYRSNLYFPTFVPEPFYTRPATPKTSETDFSGLAFSDTLSMLDDRLQLLLGLRRQQVKGTNFSATTGAVTSVYDKSANTPAVGLIVKPWGDDLSLYANYIQGLQQGTTVGVGYANAGQVLPPYKTKQYEIGLKRDWGRLLTTVSLFQITQPSAIATADNRLEADGEQRNRGIEFNAAGELSRGVRVLGGLMLLDAKLTKTSRGTYDGNNAMGAPRVQANLGLEWDPPFAPGLTLSGTVIGTGPMYVNPANTQRIGGWGRLDLGAVYRTKWADRPLALRATVRNVFNRGYWMSTGSTSWMGLGAPRTVLLSATLDF